MANKVITVTDPSVVTNDTLAGYNNYSDIDGQLGTTMTPTEATNGKTITLSDGVVHEVTTKPVGTTNGEFSAVVSNAVTVDLSGATTYGITTVESSAMHCLYDPGTSDWSVDMTLQTIVSDNATAPGSVLFATAGRPTSTHEGSIDVRIDDVGSGLWETYLSTRNVGGTIETTANYSVADGDNVKVTRVGTTLNFLINNVNQETLTIAAGWDWAATSASFANNDATPTTTALGAVFSSLTIDGIDILPTEQSSGSPITGSGIDLILVNCTYTEL